jgi:signal peptidase II
LKVLYLSFLVVLIDQISKLFVKGFSVAFLNIKFEGMYPGEKIPIIKNIFNITFIENPGIAFGIDFGAEYKILITTFTIVASLALLFYLFKIREKTLRQRIPAAFILGGAFGNLIDRVFYGVFYGYGPLLHGKVVDFFDLSIFNLFIFNKTIGNYIFNIADVAVTTGVILLLFALNKQSDSTSKEQEISSAQVESNQIGTSIDPENYLAEDKE